MGQQTKLPSARSSEEGNIGEDHDCHLWLMRPSCGAFILSILQHHGTCGSPGRMGIVLANMLGQCPADVGERHKLGQVDHLVPLKFRDLAARLAP